MKKDVKMCPTTKFIVWCILGLIICLIGMTNVFALSTTTSYASYSNGSLSNSGKYNYGYISGGVQNFTTANIGSTISGVSYGFMFYYSQNISLGNTYTLVINFHDSDLLASVTSNWVKISTCNSSACNENTLISMTKSNPNGYSNKVTFKFNPISVGSVIRFEMGGDNNQPLTGVSNFGISSIQVDVENPSQDIINNNTNNTNNIINNNNSNTQDIINNNNSNTQAIIDSNKENFQSCYSNLWGNGNIQGDRNTIANLTQELAPGTYTISYTMANSNNTNTLFQLRDSSGNLYQVSLAPGTSSKTFTISGTATKYRLYQGTAYADTYTTSMSNIMLVKGSTPQEYDDYGVEHCTNKLDEQTNAINNLNDSINDDDVDSSSWSNFFNNFTTNTFGLTSIVTAPLNLIQSLTNTSCTDLQLPLPYLNNQHLTLPCMTSIYSQHFGSFFTLYQSITYGIIAYWVCVRIFNLVKDFKNPEHDEIEVVDL